MSDQTCYVALIQDGVVRVHCADAAIRSCLKSIGARRRVRSDTWHIEYASDEQLGIIVGQLRDAGIPFVGGVSGWPPADVFVLLRDRGLTNGTFHEIVWRGAGPPVITPR